METARILNIILPGIGGSKLFCTCDKGKAPKLLYPLSCWWFFGSAIHPHLFDCRNVIAEILKQFFCKSILKKLEKRLNKNSNMETIYFAYDWRQSPLYIAREFSEWSLKFDFTKYTQINIIGHSMGGLIIRIYYEFVQYGAIFNNQNSRVYICGTPMFGSMDINDYNHGYTLGHIFAYVGYFNKISNCPKEKEISLKQIKKIQPFLFRKNDIIKLVRNFPETFIMILPTPYLRALDEKLHNNSIEAIAEFHYLVGRAYMVHKALMEFKFLVKYKFYYNISTFQTEKTNIVLVGDYLLKMFSFHNISKCDKGPNCCELVVKRVLKSDSLVLPYCHLEKLPRHCIVYLDREKIKHAYIMNSTKLAQIILDESDTMEMSSSATISRRQDDATSTTSTIDFLERKSRQQMITKKPDHNFYDNKLMIE